MVRYFEVRTLTQIIEVDPKNRGSISSLERKTGLPICYVIGSGRCIQASVEVSVVDVAGSLESTELHQSFRRV